MTQEIVDILRRAQALIDTPKKWCQGSFEHKGAHCMRGALIITCADNFQIERAAAALSRAIGLPRGTLNIAFWQDEPHRTHAEVMAAFDAAIEAEERSLHVW